MTILGFAQGTETFSDLSSNGSYLSRSWTGDDGSTWTATNSRTDETIDSRAITMNDDKANTYIQSGTISGGIGDITITTQRKYGGGSGNLDVLINGSSLGTVPYSGSVQATTIYGINVSGDFDIRIDNNIGGSNGGGADRVAVDNITWTAGAPACTAPITQASAYSTTALGTTSATLNWADGTGDEVLVVVKEGSAVDTDPEVGTTYTGNTTFTSGDPIGTGNYVVHSESATSSVSITSLTEATTYHVAVYEYNTTDNCYLTPALTGSFTTECSTPSDVTAFTASEGNEEVDLTWSNGSCFDEILVIAKEISAVTFTPTGNGSAYTANTEFGSGSDVGSSEYAVYKGTGTSATVTGLTNGNTYHFSVFTRKATSWSAAVADDATLACTAPAIQASTFTTLSLTATDVSIEFTRGGGDKVLVLMKEGSAVDEDPTSGTSYTANSNFGDLSADELGNGNFAVYNGNESSNPGIGGDLIDFNVNGLSQGTTYHLAVYEYNDINTCYNLTELIGIFTTPCAAITSFPFTEGFESGVPPTCWTSYRGTNNSGTGQDWTTSTTAYSGSVAAYVRYENVSGGFAEDWLVTPALDLSSITNTELSFYTRDSGYGDESDYSIRVSTSSQTDRESFNTITTKTSYGTTYLKEIVDLSSYDGQTIYIAFVMTQDNGDNWFLDDIEVAAGVAPNDSDTEVYEPTSQVATATITAASNTTSVTSFDAFGFEVEDQGTTDAEPTNITTMRFVPGPNNTADWTDHIQGVTLLDGNVVSYTPTTSITDTEIVLTFGSPIVVADNSSLEFLLGLYLNTTSIIDGSVIQLQIDESANGFATDIMGSGLADPFLLGDIVGNNMTIEVDATELIFSQQPSDTELNIAMSPAVTVSGVDANGNLDTDYNLDVDITSTGTLTGTPVTATAVNGIATFATLTHTVASTGLVLTADDGVFATVDSSSFDITEPIVGATDLFFSEYIEGSSNNKYLEIYNGTGADVTLTDYSIELYANGGSSPNNTEDFSSGFPATLANGEVIVLENSSASIYEGTAYSSSVCNFNGDDALVLKKDGVIIDIIGNIGCDPGSEWSDGENNTEDQTLIRNIDICGGITVDPASCTFPTLDSEWTGYPQDTISNLGSHTAECGATATTYTFNGTWSPSNPNGTATANDAIVINSGNATISSDSSINSVTVNPGAALTVSSEATLTVTEAITLESVSDNYSSLILDGTIEGTINYERHVNGNLGLGDTNANGNNDLITPPLSGQTFGAFATANSNLLTNPSDATEKAFAIFNKTTGDYENYNTTANATTILEAGTGYRATTNDTSTLIFTGTANKEDIDINIEYSGSSYEDWNLIGNPYPSYLDIEAFLTHEVATGIMNIDLLSDTSGIYGYDGDTSDGWNIINLTNASGQLMAPGQGFLVAADADHVDSYNLEFKTSMRTTGNGDDFIAGRDANTLTFFKLKASTTTTNYTTQFYFNTHASQGLDAGYDAKIWGGTAPNFSLFSHLVEDNNGVPIALQALNLTDLSHVTIPLGVNANQGEQLTFSISEFSLPSTVNVYLEDNVTNTSTLLNTGDYVLTPSTALSGMGRFYLQVSNSALSTIDNTLDYLNIYANKADKTIVVAGELATTTKATIYDVQGRRISSTQLQNNNSLQTIDVSNLNAGIYIIQLTNSIQNKTQKVIIH